MSMANLSQLSINGCSLIASTVPFFHNCNMSLKINISAKILAENVVLCKSYRYFSITFPIFSACQFEENTFFGFPLPNTTKATKSLS